MRGDLLDQLALLHLERDLGDDQRPGAAAQILLAVLRPHPEAAATGAIGRSDRLGIVDDHAAGREVRPGDEIHQGRILSLGIVDQVRRGINQLGRIVRRDRGRHADGDAAGAVGEQVGEQAGEDLRLLLLVVVGRAVIDRAFVEPGHQLDRGPRQPGLGVAHRRGVIAVDIAEIALPVDQRVA